METIIRDLLEQQGKAFEDFKKANDARLNAMAEGKAVSELESKVDKAGAELDRVAKTLDELAKKANRPSTGNDEQAQIDAEHKTAWERWARKGDDHGLADIEAKSISVGTPADGGYALPIEQDRTILRLLREQSPMRQVCRVLTIGTEDYRKLVNLGGTGSGWVGEKAARPETGTPTLAEIKPFMGEVYANPAVTQKALDDLFFNVEAELSADIVTEFAEQEGSAFLSGDGTNKPKGLLAYPQAATADGTRAFGTLQFLITGVAGGFKSPSTTVHPADDLVDLIYALKKGHRAGATFMMNGKTLSTLRKWKDAEGNYIWQPGIQAGQPSVLLGYSVTENEDMPDVGAGAIPIAFGNFQRAYWIIDRIGIRSLRDPFTNKPYVHFYTTKRVGGMLVDSEAVKLLKLAAA
ncbi:phage major capsid protein [Nitratidesulfovibrio vulgaris]|uniref:Phage major capsid protein, HK97 family n=1 Tax=Nitratidesulfovibrio vulgaris (strain DP4) TaxID=391774 RepID=A0A0H3A8T8_NITV4|nr:phage major capsid protein [Nitratidesulfovibrio vulgaris]ABM27888.1 phage major capsid protein, HK97 family [Nitratidesulfovibrio vulgaris DP4]